MGLFSRKNKIYPLKEAMEKLKMPKYADFTTVPVGNGYKLVPEKEVSKHIEVLKTPGLTQIKREKFLNEMSGNGVYKDSKNQKPNYNYWQASKNYQKQFGEEIEK